MKHRDHSGVLHINFLAKRSDFRNDQCQVPNLFRLNSFYNRTDLRGNIEQKNFTILPKGRPTYMFGSKSRQLHLEGGTRNTLSTSSEDLKMEVSLCFPQTRSGLPNLHMVNGKSRTIPDDYIHNKLLGTRFPVQKIGEYILLIKGRKITLNLTSHELVFILNHCDLRHYPSSHSSSTIKTNDIQFQKLNYKSTPYEVSPKTSVDTDLLWLTGVVLDVRLTFNIH